MEPMWRYVGNERLGLVASAAIAGLLATRNAALIAVGGAVVLFTVVSTSFTLSGPAQTGKLALRFTAAQTGLVVCLVAGTYTLSLDDFTCFCTFWAAAAGVYFFDRSSIGDTFLTALFTVAGSLIATDIVQCLSYGCRPDDGQISQLLLWTGGGLIALGAKGLELAWIMQRGGTTGRA